MKKWLHIPTSDITDERIFRSRRRFLRAMGTTGAGVLGGALLTACEPMVEEVAAKSEASASDPTTPLASTPVDTYHFNDAVTPEAMAKKYNNFYELGLGKEDPAKFAHLLQPRPWQVKVSGECDAPGVYDIDDLLRGVEIEQRVYRLRCVEAWSMVIPWDGFALSPWLQRFRPNSRAKYIGFETLYDPKQLPGQNSAVLQWPYRRTRIRGVDFNAAEVTFRSKVGMPRRRRPTSNRCASDQPQCAVGSEWCRSIHDHQHAIPSQIQRQTY